MSRSPVEYRFPWRLFAFAFLGWAFDFYDLVLLGFLKSAVGRTFGLDARAEAWMLGVALASSGLGGIVAGAAADRLGKRRLLAWTVAAYSLGTLAAGLAPSFAAFVAARFVVGLGVGGEWAIGHALVAEAVRGEVRGRAAAVLQAGEPVGVALAAVAGYVLLPRVGWRAVMIGSSATALLAVAARAGLRFHDEEPVAAPAPIATLLAPPVAGRFARALVLGIFKLGTYWTCYTWLPSFLVDNMHQSLGRSLAWMLTAQSGQLAGMVGFGIVSDKIGRRPAFAVYSVVTAAGIAPLAFAWTRLVVHPALFWSAMLALGFGSGCTAGFGALLAELYPTELRATAMGTTYNVARTAQLGAPLLVGWAAARAGLAGGLGVPLGLALATAAWVWTLPETRGVRLPSLGG